MSAQLFAQIFLTLLILDSLWSFYLSWRHENYVNNERNQVPSGFTGHIKLNEHQKAAAYTVDKQRFGRLTLMMSLLITYFWTIQGGLGWVQQSLTFISNPFLNALAFIAIISIISYIFLLPFGLYQTFVIEAKYGFNKTTLKLFISDAIKGALISMVITIPFLWIILWIMNNFIDNLWWIYAGIFIITFQLIMIWLYPTFISPIFNKFQPLGDADLNQKISNLAQQCGFQATNIQVMDGSKRSSHGNAYFTGFGKAKKIVFFDTLLEKLSHEQILAVLAHELGHFAKKHIIKSLLFNSLLIFASLFLLDWLLKSEWFYLAFQAQQSSIMALVLFSMVIPPFTSILYPVFSLFSRKHEFEADTYAAEKTAAQDLISALITLYRDNASTLTPDKLYSLWHASHPPANERINALKRYS